jgi:hypothetical protein
MRRCVPKFPSEWNLRQWGDSLQRTINYMLYFVAGRILPFLNCAVGTPPRLCNGKQLFPGFCEKGMILELLFYMCYGLDIASVFSTT